MCNKDFFIYRDISDVASKFSKLLENVFLENLKNCNVDKIKFPSNKDYNLNFWNDKIKRYVNLLQMEENMEIKELIKPRTGVNQMPSFNKEELNELEKYIDDKIEYINNNL